MLTGSLFGLSTTQALVVLFVLLPFVAGAIVVGFVALRSSGQSPPILTSDILAHGVPGKAEVVSVRNLGTILDTRPMMRIDLRVTSAPGDVPFDLEVVQSFPRVVARLLRAGDEVEIRVTPDGTAGAVVWGGPDAFTQDRQR